MAARWVCHQCLAVFTTSPGEGGRTCSCGDGVGESLIRPIEALQLQELQAMNNLLGRIADALEDVAEEKRAEVCQRLGMKEHD